MLNSKSTKMKNPRLQTEPTQVVLEHMHTPQARVPSEQPVPLSPTTWSQRPSLSKFKQQFYRNLEEKNEPSRMKAAWT